MSVKGHLSKGLQVWNNYWFYPAPLFNLAMCRVIIVTFQLGYLFARNYWGKMLTRASLPAVNYQPLPAFKILNYLLPWEAPPTFFLIVVFIATVASGILSIIGWRTKINLLLFAFGNVYIQTYIYSFGRVHHSQALMLMTLAILAVSPADKALSVDDLIKRLKKNLTQRSFQTFSLLRSRSVFARWPLLLIQWLFAFIYFSAAVHKLTLNFGGRVSLDWLNGYTLQYYLIRDGRWWDSSLGVWLGHQHFLAVISSWFAVIFEATFGLTLFFPRLIWVYIPAGAMLHTVIYMAQRAPFFQYIAIYAVFIPWAAVIKRVSNGLKWSDESQKPEIFYDGLCPICIRSMTILCYFDWFQRIVYRDLEIHGTSLTSQYPEITIEDCRDEMHLLLPNGSVKKGFFAFREMVKYVPPLWPLLAIMYFPGADIIGPKVYKYVASRRQRYDRCTFDQCSIDFDAK